MFTTSSFPRRWLAAAALILLPGCPDDPPPRREPPPPEPKAASCSGEARANDPANIQLFPRTASSFCLDPVGSDQGYGEGSKRPLDDVCNLFDGECEIYKRFDVKQVLEVHYVDGAGSGATIDVYLSKFSSGDNAYAMFTKRVVGDGDPAHPDTPRPIAGGGAAALGIGNAYVWRGPFLAEITFNDSKASAEQIQKRADKVLPPLVSALGGKLPGDVELPDAARSLPRDKQIPLGVRYLVKDVLGVEGLGPAALGYYADGEQRWRVLGMVHPDAAQAKDALASFGKLAGATKEKDLGDAAWRIMVEDGGAQTEWIIARKGSQLFGVGDEPRVLKSGMSADEHRAKTLDQEGKRKLLRSLFTSSEG